MERASSIGDPLPRPNPWAADADRTHTLMHMVTNSSLRRPARLVHHAVTVATYAAGCLHPYGHEPIPRRACAGSPACHIPDLVPDILTSFFDILLLPPRPFRTEKPLTQDAFPEGPSFSRCAAPT